MKVGIISDTHGNVAQTRAAAAIFCEYRVGAVFHCGDIGGINIVSELAVIAQSLKIPVYAVLGNMDLFSEDWKFFPDDMGISLMGRFGEVELEKKKIALLHGDDHLRLQQTIVSGDYDYVFSGHTHIFHDYRMSGTRCINPGSTGRNHPAMVVVLNLTNDELEVVPL